MHKPFIFCGFLLVPACLDGRQGFRVYTISGRHLRFCDDLERARNFIHHQIAKNLGKDLPRKATNFINAEVD
jgi:hypothetical protein